MSEKGILQGRAARQWEDSAEREQLKLDELFQGSSPDLVELGRAGPGDRSLENAGTFLAHGGIGIEVSPRNGRRTEQGISGGGVTRVSGEGQDDVGT